MSYILVICVRKVERDLYYEQQKRMICLLQLFSFLLLINRGQMILYEVEF
jgi:hypothetical protein